VAAIKFMHPKVLKNIMRDAEIGMDELKEFL